MNIYAKLRKMCMYYLISKIRKLKELHIVLNCSQFIADHAKNLNLYNGELKN